MARYFTLAELTRSATATAKGIDNTPSAEVIGKLEYLADNVLDKVRALWGAPIIVNSGYRCPALNTAVGGSRTSQHMTGEAADITTGTVEDNKRLFDMIIKAGIDFDQLIDERRYTWLHISCKYGSVGNRHQLLHL